MQTKLYYLPLMENHIENYGKIEMSFVPRVLFPPIHLPENSLEFAVQVESSLEDAPHPSTIRCLLFFVLCLVGVLFFLVAPTSTLSTLVFLPVAVDTSHNTRLCLCITRDVCIALN